MATLKPKEFSRIRDLYTKKLLSAPEIAAVCKVSLDAVYYFMRANGIARRSWSDQNRVRFDKKPLSFRLKKRLSKSEIELKTIGTVLYWGEGYKADSANGIDFANSDPEMAVIFMRFLREICGVNNSRIKVFIYCYANQDIKRLTHFWRKKLKVPTSQFTKPYVRTDFRKGKENKMPYGLVHIRYNDKKLLFLVKQWIKEYKDTHCVGTQVVNEDAL